MRRNGQPKINLTKEEENSAVQALIEYFDKERGEKLGNLEALLLLQYITEKIGPLIYNHGILDAQRFMSEHTEELYGLML